MVAQAVVSESPFVAKALRLTFHGKILDQLGIQIYQSPIASLAELVANAWDADATTVNITLPDKLDEHSVITVEDDGRGMTFEQCQDEYMSVGYDRRQGKGSARTPSGRLVMGRKGIGKFAGFGIAKRIRVETASGATGEETDFEMDICELRRARYLTEGGTISARTRQGGHGGQVRRGTRITLSGLIIARNVSRSRFPRSMASRFLVQQTASDFEIRVNGDPIPESLDLAPAEFAFPRDYPSGREPVGLQVDGQWAVEMLPDGHTIKWKIGFAKDPIGDGDLQGVAVFANGKMAQRPFFFNLTGALPGQHGQSYMFGQVSADYVDQMDADVISAERQRINWEAAETQALLEWGQRRTRDLLRLWGELRAEKKVGEIEARISPLGGRLAKLKRHEQKAVKAVLKKLAGIPSIRDDRFEDLAGAILTSWEGGRLRELWQDIEERETLSEADLLDMLVETNVVTALNVAEAVKTKVAALVRLGERIDKRDLEHAVRDHVANNPWIISPEWEYYRKEARVSHIAQDAAKAADLTGDVYRGRVDLLLSSGDHLLVLEFLRPGLALDTDHLQRCANYVAHIRAAVEKLSALPFAKVSGLIVADRIPSRDPFRHLIEMYAKSDILVTDWHTVISDARARHEEFLRILGERDPDDERLRSATAPSAPK